ncbi:hypothetical protein Taro_024349 [Colocasia esculenta]|uniref:Uncharacterized protein n=1 Tax=Colocasia esculenta TaxID=4460 RepID=A0A843VDE3_COLES|nr:hypothetical protein [Colocasia esculenta]
MIGFLIISMSWIGSAVPRCGRPIKLVALSIQLIQTIRVVNISLLVNVLDLTTARLGGAGLDVLEGEPEVPGRAVGDGRRGAAALRGKRDMGNQDVQPGACEPSGSCARLAALDTRCRVRFLSVYGRIRLHKSLMG